MPTTTAPRLVSRRPTHPGGVGGATPPRVDDAASYVIRKRVPILDAHDHPKKGKVDLALLRLLAHNSNNLARGGNYALVTLGHTTDDGPEIDQPPPVGYAKNFSVEPFTDHLGTRPCLHADFHLDARHAKTAFTFPHRSVERVVSADKTKNIIDLVALLRRAPERHLSLLTYRQSDPTTRVVRYARDLPPIGRGRSPNQKYERGSDMDPTALREMFKEVMKEVMMEALGDGGAPEGGELPPEEDMGDLPGDELGEGDPDGDLGDEGMDDELGDEGAEDEMGGEDENASPPMKKYKLDGGPGGEKKNENPAVRKKKYDMAAPSASNAFAPKQVGKTTVKCGSDGKPLREERSVSRYQRAIEERDAIIAEKDAEIEGIKLRYARDSARRSQLAKMVEEDGYDLDIDEEVSDHSGSGKAKWDKHVEKIATRYARIPLNQPRIASSRPTQESDDIDRDDAPAVARYARQLMEKDGISHQAALEQTFASQVSRFQVGR